MPIQNKKSEYPTKRQLEVMKQNINIVDNVANYELKVLHLGVSFIFNIRWFWAQSTQFRRVTCLHGKHDYRSAWLIGTFCLN